MLAQNDGLTLVGRLSALRGKAAPVLDDVPEAAAGDKAPLPTGNVFFRGAACRWSGTFSSAVTLTFTLPKAIFSGRKLPVYRYRRSRLAAIGAQGGRRQGEHDRLHHDHAARHLRFGLFSDMTTQPGFGPWVTGRRQLFAPKASTHPPPAYDRAVITILSELRWEKAALDDIDW